jgi:tryptophan halogenase
MTGERAIRTIAVAGSATVGLSAAIVFARALSGTSVTVIETRPDPAAVADLIPTTWPAVTRFHAALGLDEQELVAARIATHHLGTIFDDWSPNGQQWVHAFGNYGKPVGVIPFDHVWWRAHEEGNALPYDRYSIGAALARAGKFVHPGSDPNSIGSRYQYGLRLDPAAYRDRLRVKAAACGVAFSRSNIDGIDRSGHGIRALMLADGTRIEADLFVDCTGPSAGLIGAVDDSFEDWSAWMPFDRLLLDIRESPEIPPTGDRVRATDDGWSVEWPLRGQTVRAKLRIGGEGIALLRGRRVRPWAGNVLALGDAATALDPVLGMSLELAQQAILLAVELMPGREFNPLETKEYNRRAEQLTSRVRDFVALHYLRSGRTTGVWRDFISRDPPQSLVRTLDQFRYRGRLPFYEEERVTRDSWTSALIGMGLLPQHGDPQAGGVGLDKAVPAMRQLAREIDKTVARLPSYGDYLAGMR